MHLQRQTMGKLIETMDHYILTYKPEISRIWLINNSLYLRVI